VPCMIRPAIPDARYIREERLSTPRNERQRLQME
jgi:hypothetical protein